MGERTYKDATALEMAVKTAARKSGQDVGKAIEAYYPGRLLERIFSVEEPRFVLKGGRSILSRTVDARYTRDTDFVYEGADLDEALEELRCLAAIDLGDFLEFRFVSAERIAESHKYRNGYRVVFTPVLGGTKAMSDVSVDLVADQVDGGTADVVTPANRLDVEGMPVFDYCVYPVANAVADKICATMQTYPGGRPSSRVRDLVDLAIFATTESVEGSTLSERLTLEARLRNIDISRGFRVPKKWHGAFSGSFVKSAKEAKLPEDLRSVDMAEQLAKRCVDPAIAGEVDGMTWSPEKLQWL